MKIRYFDHAATTAVREEVVRAMLPYLGVEYGNPSSVYSLGRKNKKIVEENQISSEVKIELGVSAYISDSYIQDTVQKIAMYQKISDIKTSEDALDIIDELIDDASLLEETTNNFYKIKENIIQEIRENNPLLDITFITKNEFIKK